MHPVRKQLRLKYYDYSQYNWYFVTTCTQNRQEWFGNISKDTMCLNESGKIIVKQWLWLSEQYSYIQLDEWIVMPNHMHGIIIIDPLIPVGTGRDLSLQNTKIKSLSEIIGAFKTTSSKLIHQMGNIEFKWQRSFYEHIIREDDALEKIRLYIKYNPQKWHEDRNNPSFFRHT